MDKVIKVACQTKDTIDFHEIKTLQGNYKKLSDENLEKLCRIIIKRGIRFPSFVCKIGGYVYAIDTHQRLKAFEELEQRGYYVPLIPIVYIDSKDKNEAKQILLECDSRYGQATQDGFEEFIEDLDVSAFDDEFDKEGYFNGLELVGIDLDFNDTDQDIKPLELELEKNRKEEKGELCVCPKCGLEFIK